MNSGYVVGIGAANIDIYGKSLVPLREKTDHPAKVFTGIGGVTRNILDNLMHLDIPCVLMTAVGDDIYGKIVLSAVEEQGMDIRHALVVPGASTGVFIQVLSENNDMELALCDMGVMSHITEEYLREHHEVLENAHIIVIDPSLPEETIEYLVDHFGDKIFLDPVSDILAEKMKPFVGRICAVKPNRTELEVLSGMPVRDPAELIAAGRKVIESGTKTLYISLGRDGCLYMDHDRQILQRFHEEKEMVNASGAGDSFFAGIICGLIDGLEIESVLDLGLAAGILAVRSKEVISPLLSRKNLQKIIKENRG